MRGLISLTALALLGAAGAQAPGGAALTSPTWTLTGLSDGGRTFLPVPGAEPPTLRLDGRTASGSTGCNTYRAAYAQRGDILRFGPLATTRRACLAPLSGQEARFLNLLREVTRFQLSGRTLTLFSGSRGRLVFQTRAAAVPALPETTMTLDGTWTLGGGTALRPVPGAPTPSLTFQGDRVSGTGGCNRLMGAARLSGTTLTLGPLATTRMACPPAVSAQETAFLNFLQGPLRAERQGQTLRLTGRNSQTLMFRRVGGQTGSQSGETGAAAPPASAQANVPDGTYTLAQLNGQPAPTTAEPVRLVLQGGRLGGSDGCNSLSGGYRLEGARLVLTGELVSTLRACPDTATVNLARVLADRPTVTVTPSGLTLTAGGTTLSFERSR